MLCLCSLLTTATCCLGETLSGNSAVRLSVVSGSSVQLDTPERGGHASFIKHTNVRFTGRVLNIAVYFYKIKDFKDEGYVIDLANVCPVCLATSIKVKRSAIYQMFLSDAE